MLYTFVQLPLENVQTTLLCETQNTSRNVISSSLLGEWGSSLMWLLFLHNRGKNHLFLGVWNELWLELDQMLLMNIHLHWLRMCKAVLKCGNLVCTDHFYSSDEENHRIIKPHIGLGWRDIKSQPVPPLPYAGPPSTSPGCYKPHPTWPLTLPGMGHPQLLWATCSNALLLSQ